MISTYTAVRILLHIEHENIGLAGKFSHLSTCWWKSRAQGIQTPGLKNPLTGACSIPGKQGIFLKEKTIPLYVSQADLAVNWHKGSENIYLFIFTITEGTKNKMLTITM